MSEHVNRLVSSKMSNQTKFHRLNKIKKKEAIDVLKKKISFSINLFTFTILLFINIVISSYLRYSHLLTSVRFIHHLFCTQSVFFLSSRTSIYLWQLSISEHTLVIYPFTAIVLIIFEIIRPLLVCH